MNGRECAAYILERGHTQASAAEALGVTRETINRWCRRDGELPRLTELQLAQLPQGNYVEEDDLTPLLPQLLPLVRQLLTTDLD